MSHLFKKSQRSEVHWTFKPNKFVLFEKFKRVRFSAQIGISETSFTT